MRSSSHVIHVPHGIAPPAQLVSVPEEVTKERFEPAVAADEQPGRAGDAVGAVRVGADHGRLGRGVGRAQLVVAHEDRRAVGPREGGHAVEVVRDRLAVGEAVVGGLQHAVAEALGQVQEAARIGQERAVAAAAGAERDARPGRDRQCAGADRAATDERPACVHGSPPEGGFVRALPGCARVSRTIGIVGLSRRSLLTLRFPERDRPPRDRARTRCRRARPR